MLPDRCQGRRRRAPEEADSGGAPMRESWVPRGDPTRFSNVGDSGSADKLHKHAMGVKPPGLRRSPARQLGAHQAAGHGLPYGFRARVDVEPVVDLAHVMADGVEAEAERIGAAFVAWAVVP